MSILKLKIGWKNEFFLWTFPFFHEKYEFYLKFCREIPPPPTTRTRWPSQIDELALCGWIERSSEFDFWPNSSMEVFLPHNTTSFQFDHRGLSFSYLNFYFSRGNYFIFKWIEREAFLYEKDEKNHKLFIHTHFCSFSLSFRCFEFMFILHIWCQTTLILNS